MSTNDGDLLALERSAVMFDGPLVPLLSPKLDTSSSLPRLIRSDSTRMAPFGPSRRDWTCDTFIVPAAFPRSSKRATIDPTNESTQAAAAPNEARAQRQRPDPKQLYRQLMEKQVAAHQQEVDVNDKDELNKQQQLYLAVNRYKSTKPRRHPNAPVLTLVFAHANGFHKETWEPTMADLLEQLDRQPDSLPVEEIWSLDACNQGDSGVINEPVLGETFNWADHGRDIAQFLVSYIDDPKHSTPSTEYILPSISTDPKLLSLDTATSLPGSDTSKSRTFRNRLIVGVGHSLGGGGMAFAASAVPSLFSSIIFCDPVLVPTEVERSVSTLTMGALIRREQWSSKQDAKQAFLAKSFFKKWDERVLDLYCQQGLKDMLNGMGVKLKCRAKDEALVFCDPCANSSRRACARSVLIPKSLKVHFVFADEGVSVLSEDMIKSVLNTISHATFSRVKGAGHLIAQEDPKQTAQRIAEFLIETYSFRQGSAKL
ncbi:hypothetical protein OIO90_002329 [Microbotryomycetes sp. JL221]|nr:hypothetical protein OIO90_002329 [Microbotryomycetes sp. JL221]